MSKNSVFSSLLLVMLLATGLGQLTAAADEKKELTFALVRTQEMGTLGAQWDDVLTYVSKKVGADINFYATTSYASVVEAMLGGFVDIGKLGPKIYIVAREKSQGQIEPVAAAAKPPTVFYDKPCACYFGTLITKKGSEFTTIDSLKGKVLALVDPGSTSGYALPRALFPDAIGGKSLEEYFGRIFYSGSHSASALAVYNGKADAAFVSESTLERVIHQGKMKKDDLNYLWRSPKIPIDVVTVNKKTLSPEMIQKITKAFTEMTETDEGRKALKAARYYAFTPAEDADFDSLRKILAAKAKAKK